MTKAIATVLATGLMFNLCVQELRAQDKAAADQLDKKADTLNAAAKKSGKMTGAYQCIATETGVPLDRVEKLHKDNPEVGPAGLLLAFALAGETKRPASHFVESRTSGKSWGAIAHDNKVSIEKLNQHLDHVTTCITSAPAKAEPKEKK